MGHQGRHDRKMAADWAEGSLIINVNLWLLIINGYNKKTTKLTHATLQKFLDMKLTKIIHTEEKNLAKTRNPQNFVLMSRRRRIS